MIVVFTNKNRKMDNETFKGRFLCMPSLLLLCILAAGCRSLASDIGVLLESFVGQSHVLFYGMVVDQHGKPVYGAKVVYEVESFGLPFPGYRKGSARTGKDGRFIIRDGFGSRMDIENILLKGYEFPMAGKTREYEYREYYADCFKPDKSKPEVFVIRRKEDSAVYLYKRGRINIECSAIENEKWRGLDLRWGDCKMPYEKNHSEYFYDIELTWEHDSERKEWTIIVTANGEEAGFQLLDEKLYVAPSEGYVKEQSFKVGYFGFFDKPPAKHVYLRLRDSGMYARLDITSACADENKFVIRGEAFINPYGDRCLEPIEFDYNDEEKIELNHKCRDEAREAMRNHKLAPRPPFEQWIKEGKAKY